jgi:hypothetical protein
LTQKTPECLISGQDRDSRPAANTTSCGSSDSEANDWQVKPAGCGVPSFSLTLATMVTPLQKRLMTCR